MVDKRRVADKLLACSERLLDNSRLLLVDTPTATLAALNKPMGSSLGFSESMKDVSFEITKKLKRVKPHERDKVIQEVCDHIKTGKLRPLTAGALLQQLVGSEIMEERLANQ